MSISQPQAYNAVTGTTAASSGGAVDISNNKDKMEDCRDYLRTGRCKYGASCKYYHPPNVQSGGGMKTPLDPTEPMFPLRPSEPICQYYIKHGTCKFGQACKFHHPPMTQHAAAGAHPMLVNTGPGRKAAEPPTQLVAVGPPGSDLTHMMVQFLPQRPDEPDCIYFLKNGRCKYGATCRYHHPIHTYTQPAQSRQARHARSTPSDSYMTTAKRIPYVAQHVGVGHPPGHILVASDGGPVSFVNIDNVVASAAGFKPVTFITTGGEIFTAHHGPYGLATSAVFSGSTVMTEQGSSASSVASSFDTASSSLDITGSDAAAAALWNRARRNGSGGSLNAFDKVRAPVTGIPTSSSDGNIARRAHSSSIGSASEYQAAYVEITPPGSRSGTWQNRSPSFDQQTKRSGIASGDSRGSADAAVAAENHGGAVHPVTSSGRPPIASRGARHRPRGGGDEGFTMMTSALLNMLDTQEEGSAEAHSDDEGSYIAGNRRATSGEDGSYSRYSGLENGYHDIDSSGIMEHLSFNTPQVMAHPQELRYSGTTTEDLPIRDGRWPSDWGEMQAVQGSDNGQRHTNAHRPPPHPPSSYQANDFGYYLP